MLSGLVALRDAGEVTLVTHEMLRPNRTFLNYDPRPALPMRRLDLHRAMAGYDGPTA